MISTLLGTNNGAPKKVVPFVSEEIPPASAGGTGADAQNTGQQMGNASATVATGTPVLTHNKENNTLVDENGNAKKIESTQYNQVVNGTTTNGSTTQTNTNTPDYAAGQQQAQQQVEAMQPYLDRQAALDKAHVTSMGDLYSRLNPDTAPVKQKEMNVNNWQTLVTALSNLGKSLGKAGGNSKGRGLVTEDKEDNNIFQTRFNAGEASRKAYEDALNADKLTKLKQQMELLNAQYNADKNNLTKEAQIYENALNNSLARNNTATQTTTGSTTQTQNTIGHSTEKGLTLSGGGKGTPSMTYGRGYGRSSSGKKGSSKNKTILVKNPMYDKPGRLGSSDRAKYINGDSHLSEIIDKHEIEYTPEEARVVMGNVRNYLANKQDSKGNVVIGGNKYTMKQILGTDKAPYKDEHITSQLNNLIAFLEQHYDTELMRTLMDIMY